MEFPVVVQKRIDACATEKRGYRQFYEMPSIPQHYGLSFYRFEDSCP
jgi:hypothetical protein